MTKKFYFVHYHSYLSVLPRIAIISLTGSSSFTSSVLLLLSFLLVAISPYLIADSGPGIGKPAFNSSLSDNAVYQTIPRMVVVMSLSMMLVMVVLLLLSVFLPSAMDSKRSEKRVWHIITTSNCNNKHKCCTTVVHYDYTASLLLHTTQYDPILHSIQYPRILNTKYYTVSPILHIAEYLPPPLYTLHTIQNTQCSQSCTLHSISYLTHCSVQPHPTHYTVFHSTSYTLHSIQYPTSFTVPFILHSFLQPTQYPQSSPELLTILVCPGPAASKIA